MGGTFIGADLESRRIGEAIFLVEKAEKTPRLTTLELAVLGFGSLIARCQIFREDYRLRYLKKKVIIEPSVAEEVTGKVAEDVIETAHEE